MKIQLFKSGLIVFIFLLNLNVYSQELEFGPLLNYERTSFNIPDDSFIVIGGPGGGGPGSRTTGFETNFAFGGFATYYFDERIAVSGELFYVKTTATEFPGLAFTSLNLIPYVSVGLFNKFPLYLNLGGGVAYMLSTPNFEEYPSIPDEDVKNIDIPIKAGFSYRIHHIVTIELGVHTSFTRVVKDELLRTHHYLGVKIPLNALLMNQESSGMQ